MVAAVAAGRPKEVGAAAVGEVGLAYCRKKSKTNYCFWLLAFH